MEANPDFKDLLQCLNDARVRYLLVGAHAVAYHSEPQRFDSDQAGRRPAAGLDGLKAVEPTRFAAATTREAQDGESVIDS